ncbi:hypothetical protein BVI434_3020018 [Burkholderia vietnamiensis]|nr:hypothetical protein BVI434_3020018 [Burkholderia vietnamiensis]
MYGTREPSSCGKCTSDASSRAANTTDDAVCSMSDSLWFRFVDGMERIFEKLIFGVYPESAIAAAQYPLSADFCASMTTHASRRPFVTHSSERSARRYQGRCPCPQRRSSRSRCARTGCSNPAISTRRASASRA